MGQKEGNNGGEKKKNNNGGEGEKKGGDIITVVLGDSKMKFEGVRSVHVDLPNKVRVSAQADLGKPRDMVEPKGKKKGEVVSHLPKNDNKKGEGKPEKKADDKKAKDKKAVADALKKKLNKPVDKKAVADAPKKKLNKPVDIIRPKKGGGGN